MTEYTTVDKDALFDEISELSDVLEETNLSDEHRKRASSALSQINSIVHSIEKPIHIEDRTDGFEIVVTE